ncbi:hypothetical protein LXL04_007921 [Taraxacum kok-saghyz]
MYRPRTAICGVLFCDKNKPPPPATMATAAGGGDGRRRCKKDSKYVQTKMTQRKLTKVNKATEMKMFARRFLACTAGILNAGGGGVTLFWQRLNDGRRRSLSGLGVVGISKGEMCTTRSKARRKSVVTEDGRRWFLYLSPICATFDTSRSLSVPPSRARSNYRWLVAQDGGDSIEGWRREFYVRVRIGPLHFLATVDFMLPLVFNPCKTDIITPLYPTPPPRVPCTPHTDYSFPYTHLVIPYVPSTHLNTSLYLSCSSFAAVDFQKDSAICSPFLSSFATETPKENQPTLWPSSLDFTYLGFNKPSDHGPLRDGETQTRASHRVSHCPKDYVPPGVSSRNAFTSVDYYHFSKLIIFKFNQIQLLNKTSILKMLLSRPGHRRYKLTMNRLNKRERSRFDAVKSRDTSYSSRSRTRTYNNALDERSEHYTTIV